MELPAKMAQLQQPIRFKHCVICCNSLLWYTSLCSTPDKLTIRGSRKFMASSSTIPSIAGGQQYNTVTLHWVDDNDKRYASSMRVKDGMSDPELQALVDDSQAASNASSWRLEVTEVYFGARNKSNADSAVHESIADKIRLSYKDTAGAYEQGYLPAPLAVLIDESNNVVTGNALYIAWKAAIEAIKQVGMVALNVEFVQYLQRNDVQSP